MAIPEQYSTTPVRNIAPFAVRVPGSKSITNRALLLAALSDCDCTLKNVLFSADSRALLEALSSLGIRISANEDTHTVTVSGCNKSLPAKSAVLYAASAGTAARFLTAMLSFSDGSYTLTASEQMKQRPMAPLFDSLSSQGVSLQAFEEPGHLPVHITGIQTKTDSTLSFSVNIDKSSQFLSALMMTGNLLPHGITITAEGARTALSYVSMTERMMGEFGAPPQPFTQDGCICAYRIDGTAGYHRENYVIEPDISGACYFYAAAALLGTSVTVLDVHPDSMQGDFRFLSVLEHLGCLVKDTPDGICVTGPKNGHYPGLDLCMSDFSDQTMTMAVLALFADSPTHIRGISHIRGQECDRMAATIAEITKLGGDVREDGDGTGLIITPRPLHGAVISTYDDHRMAMSFALAGLRVEGVVIDNPSCCKKTFENYFTLFSECFRQEAAQKPAGKNSQN